MQSKTMKLIHHRNYNPERHQGRLGIFIICDKKFCITEPENYQFLLSMCFQDLNGSLGKLEHSDWIYKWSQANN